LVVGCSGNKIFKVRELSFLERHGKGGGIKEARKIWDGILLFRPISTI
jgi:hypothetical protein